MPNPSTQSVPSIAPLPIDAVLDKLKLALRSGLGAVLQAPPGAGKTTRVPLALLEEPWLEGRKIVMLEPRRLAARAAARHMAGLLGEPVGATVGYRVRMDTQVGPATRIEVVTEGVLTRMLQSDPGLAGVGLVIFDEFHERHLESDLGLALCLDLQGVLNPGLRLLVMSATLEPAPVAGLLGGAPVIACEGRQFPVETRYLGRPSERAFEAAVAGAVVNAARNEAGSLLVFLPGAAEIRRVHAMLASAGLGAEWILAPLFGNLSKEEQDQAIAPAPQGRRKIVLATNIAETSLTIEGIRVVVDGGLMRTPCFDVRSGMARLVTVPVSRSAADQRRGRAGRTGPGVCHRLWTAEAHAALAERNRPEILQTDLAPLVLELALWGVADPAGLKWLDPPPEAACRQARALLESLGALDATGRATDRGRRMAALPLHPRLAHMVLEAQRHSLGADACLLAAVLSERDFVRFPAGEYDSDLGLRLDIMADQVEGRGREAGRFAVDRPALRRCLRVAEALRARLGLKPHPRPQRAAGRLLSWAYPDRIGQRRPGAAGRFQLANGRGAFFPGLEPLSSADWIVAAELDGERQEARIFLAAACDLQTIQEDFQSGLRREDTVQWDRRIQAVRVERALKLGALTLKSFPAADADPMKIRAAMVSGIREAGLECLPWTPGLRRWRERVLFLRRVMGEESWPDVSDAALLAALEGWLGPHLDGITRLTGLKGIDLGQALSGFLAWDQARRLDALAPTHIQVPTGSRIRVDYSGEVPVLAVRVQEMFGCTDTPRIAGGRQPVTLQLLSPAGRPVQVTRDLAGFWAGSYREVRKEMRGRYPKHPWPEDPLHAAPTRRAKKAGGHG
ncbi:MAG: ATP-dependent helicase HrpB [Desulfobacterales bacterium]|nr:ATP-dependent helicase HrpB [Desulfobacterales bacterium]